MMPAEAPKMSQSLMSRDRAEARKKGLLAVSAWAGAGILTFYSIFGGLVLGGAAAFLTYRWFMFRAKRGMRF
jgi:hypothetical protein